MHDKISYRIHGIARDWKWYEHEPQEEIMNLENPGRVRFDCSDVVAKNCDWKVNGSNEQEVMSLVEQHCREKHGLRLDDQIRDGLQRAIKAA